MNVSYLVITYNRREGLLANLQAIYSGDANADVWVVDNASTDGTGDAIRDSFPRARLIQLDKNLGMPARNVALQQMTSEYVVLLDDDSHPVGDAVEWSVAYMTEHRDVAVVVGRVVLPNDDVEAPAMPAVMLGGASCVRLRALRDVGFFPHDFFRQAEEYDLSARLWHAGHRIVRFEDVIYRHNKSTGPGRASRDVSRLDLKHNLIIAARHLPAPFDEIYWDDFAARYRAIMTANGFAADFDEALSEAERYVFDAHSLRRQRLHDDAFEAMFQHRSQLRRVSQWSEANGVRGVVIADVSKNLYATYQACRRLGLEIAAIIDDRPAFAGTTYRHVPVVASGTFSDRVDGVVVSNTNPAQINGIANAMIERFGQPNLTLWMPKYVKPSAATPERIAA
jgi:GT2 family glycosyltransferase